MRPQTALLLAVGLFNGISSAAVLSVEQQGCGTELPSPGLVEIAKTMQRESKAAPHLQRRYQNTSLTIPTYFHVVESGAAEGTITTKMLEDQLKVLQETFAPHRIQFKLQETTWNVNDAWAAVVQHAEMSKTLRRGNYSELNIYFQTGMSGGQLTGWCNFPEPDPINTSINGTSYYVFDGCHLNPDTLPGGAGSGVGGLDNKGKTATHEVGHWFGLFHTFQGFDCEDPEGDLIDDTPVQSEATRGCPVNPPKDSCPGKPGVDPIHNYMDYSSHDCITQFTPQQEQRMYEMFNTLRVGI